MAVRSVFIGHANSYVDRRAYQKTRQGVNLSRPTPEEFALAEELLDAFPGSEMVKFGKNGSDATAAAVRLARAATGRDMILRSDQAPFLGVHDWFIGSTVMNEGVPQSVRELTQKFRYGDLEDLERKLTSLSGRVAAVILEPLGLEEPAPNYLRELKKIVQDYGALLIFDEVVSGFRLGYGGYQQKVGVTPDLTALGKALANGYPLSALAGRAEVMELGGIRHHKRRVFLMSSTYGPERSAIGASLATLEWLRKKNPYPLLERNMKEFTSSVVRLFAEANLAKNIVVSGLPISPNISFIDSEGATSQGIKTLFMEAMATRGVLLGAHLFSPSASHDTKKMKWTLEAIRSSLVDIAPLVVAKTEGQIEEYGLEIVKPVFREFN